MPTSTARPHQAGICASWCTPVTAWANETTTTTTTTNFFAFSNGDGVVSNADIPINGDLLAA